MFFCSFRMWHKFQPNQIELDFNNFEWFVSMLENVGLIAGY